MAKKYRGFSIWFLLLALTITQCRKDNVVVEGIHFTGYRDAVIDIDGNGYQTFGMGTQTWMSSNLRTSRLNNGTKISLVTENSQWESISQPSYCWYNNDSVINERFGVLYNFTTVETGLICPVGWHVPTQDDWNYLVKGFGGISTAGGTMKGYNRGYNSILNSPWYSTTFSAPQTFLALPAGLRNANSQFMNADSLAYFWTLNSKSDTGYSAIILKLLNDTVFSSHFSKKDGLSIRCVKDN